MKIALSRAHYPVTALGPGRRIGIWFQGCTIQCKGCASRDTWPVDLRSTVEIDDLMSWCRTICPVAPDGVTISGGEPFEQPEALEELVDRLRAWRADSGSSFDLLGYTGFGFDRLIESFPKLVRKFDALIPEPFILSRPLGLAWSGSDNQPLIALTPLGAELYGPYLSGISRWRPTLQVSVDERAVWLIGIPERNHLNMAVQLASEQGVSLEGCSWKA